MSKNKSRLGRGLSSLLSIGEEPEVDISPESPANPPPPAAVVPDARSGERMFHVELSSIAVNPYQPRRQFEEAGLRQLADSLITSGLIQPIVVRHAGEGYELVAGERRFRAAKLAGLARLPAVVRDATPVEQAQLALVENIHRENLNPIDRATAYRQLLTHLGITQEELARRLNEERSTVANYLRLLDLADPVRQRVVDGSLSMGHAKLLAGVHDVLEQKRLAELVAAEQLSVRNLERLLQNELPSPAAKPVIGKASAHIIDLEKQLSRDLQMRCQVRRTGTKGRGRLVIHYGSLDQFDQLLTRLGIAPPDA